MDYDIQYRLADVQEILNLRAAELRSGKPIDTARFPEDNLSTTIHFGGFIENKPICCLTLLEQPDTEIPTWQLRGMATDKSWQRKGIGRCLIQYAESYVMSRNPALNIWCNAREIAVPFYTQMGYRISSEPFLIRGVGIHYKMEKTFM